jgi:hypothetical protein
MHTGDKKMKMKDLMTDLLAVTLLIACGSCTVHLRTDLSFLPKDTKIQKSALIDISAKTKEYVLEKGYAGRGTLPIGQALEPNALTAFRAVIENVSTEKGDAAIDRIIEISFGPQTAIQLGAFTFSENKCVVGLECSIKDSTGNVVWSRSVRGEASEKGSGNKAIGRMVDVAMTKALQNLADQAEEQKQVIFQ